MRSVAVVLPASMWAMMPMLRTRSSSSIFGTRELFCVSTTAIGSSLKAWWCALPAVVREGLVRLGHAVHVVLALERPALLVGRVEDLADELVGHLLLTPLAGEQDEPADGEGASAAGGNLDRHLVVGAADAPRADLERGRDGLDCLLENLDRRAARLLAPTPARGVDDPFGGRLLAVEHDLVHELRDELRPVDRVGDQLSNRDLRAAGHQPPPFLAPYLERPWRRSETPAASSAARITL